MNDPKEAYGYSQRCSYDGIRFSEGERSERMRKQSV